MAVSVGPVRDAATFRALRRSSRRVRRGPLTVTFVGCGPLPAPRVAYAVGRNVGGAVVRNRVRRRLRAICSELGPELAPGSYLIAVAPEAARWSFAELRACVGQAVEALAGGRRP